MSGGWVARSTCGSPPEVECMEGPYVTLVGPKSRPGEKALAGTTSLSAHGATTCR